MGFSAENGYIPVSVNTIMESIMANINVQFGTNYTIETFVGTGFYKYFYALAQRVQENEVKASEVFLKLQDYFRNTNEQIINPKVTPNGLIEALELAGYRASVKPMIEAEAGELHVCVDVDDEDPEYAATRLEICGLLRDYTPAGVVTIGTESETLTLSNTQEFEYAFNLPTKTEILLRLTLTLSRNNQNVIADPDDTKLLLFERINEEYALGKDFEPERYFTVADAPWASDIKLEYSLDDGDNWLGTVYESDYDELFVILLENITLIEE
jgi:hypothetical protein